MGKTAATTGATDPSRMVGEAILVEGAASVHASCSKPSAAEVGPLNDEKAGGSS